MEEVKRTELEKKIDILEDDIADISPEIFTMSKPKINNTILS